jgi:hypothetical protein
VIEGQESIVRSFLGCPEFILRSIQFFSNQRHFIAEPPPCDESSTKAHIQDTTLTMIELTETFDSYEWASQFHLSTTSPTTETNNLYLLSEAYKTAALLYGRQVLASTGTYREPAETQTLLSQLLASINALKGEDTFKCLLWPTFLAGLHCLERGQQESVTDSLRRVWDLTKCLNVISAADILRKYWERVRSSGVKDPWRDGLVELDRHWLLI